MKFKLSSPHGALIISGKGATLQIENGATGFQIEKDKCRIDALPGVIVPVPEHWQERIS